MRYLSESALSLLPFLSEDCTFMLREHAYDSALKVVLYAKKTKIDGSIVLNDKPFILMLHKTLRASEKLTAFMSTGYTA